MGDTIIEEVRAGNLIQESHRIYRILVSGGLSVEGGQSGMVELMGKTFRAAPNVAIAFIFSTCERFDPRTVSRIERSGSVSGIPSSGALSESHDVGIGIFECLITSTHREYRVMVSVKEKYQKSKEGFEGLILKKLLAHAKSVAGKKKNSFILDAICRPIHERLIQTYQDAGFVPSPGASDGREQSESLDIVVLRMNISHKEG